MKKTQTIYDIAKALKVSPGTVSKVINNSGNVSQKTRETIQNYIESVGYVPSMSARMLKSKQTKTIGVIYAEELGIGLEHTFFSSILQHFKTYMENEGYELSFIVTKLGKNQQSYYKWCMNKRVDGVYIVVGDYEDQGIHELVKSGIPCISTDLTIEGLHTVISDNDNAVKEVLSFIKNYLNKTKVKMISGPLKSKAFSQRVNAILTYADDFGLRINNNDIFVAEGFGFTSGYKVTQELLNSNDIPEVIFCSSDELATGVIKALLDKNYKIPKDIQVIGFDDISLARYITPSLTTVAQDKQNLGQTAARTLISLIEQPELTIKQLTLLPVKIVQRESTHK